MKLTQFILFLASIINLCQCNNIIKYSQLQNERPRRDLSSSITNKFTDFVQEKLTQNSKELEIIIKAVYKSGSLIKKLLEKFDLEGHRSKFMGSIETRGRSRSYETDSGREKFYSNDENLDDDRPHARFQRNAVSEVDLSKFVEFVEEKLMQHSSALEFIIKSVQNSEGLLKKIEKFELSSVESKRFDADNGNGRRSERDHERNKPTERLKRLSPFEQLVRYGSLARRLIENEYGPDDPIPIEETDRDESSGDKPESVEATSKPTRRSFHAAPPPKESPKKYQTQTTPAVLSRKDTLVTSNIGNVTTPAALTNEQNPWCASAAICQGNRVKVCAHDANYTHGVGQFDDVCHMVKYNCQSNYNFKVTPCDEANQHALWPRH